MPPQEMKADEVRKSVHFRLPLFTRKRLRRLAEKRGTSMTGVLVDHQRTASHWTAYAFAAGTVIIVILLAFTG